MTPKKCMSIAKSLTNTQHMELEPQCTAGSSTGGTAGLGQGPIKDIAESSKRTALEQVHNDDKFVSECKKENIDASKIKKLRLEAEFLDSLVLDRILSEPLTAAKNVVEKQNISRSPPSTSAMLEPKKFNAGEKLGEERKMVSKTKEMQPKVSIMKMNNLKTQINMPATPEYEPAYPNYAPVIPVTEYYPELIKYFPSSPTKHSPLTPENSPKNPESSSKNPEYSPKNNKNSPKNNESPEDLESDSSDSDSSDSEDEFDWSLSALKKK